jgi:uncharacterized damage-inducible protein DinB
VTREEAALLLEFHVWADRRALAASARLPVRRFLSAALPGEASPRDMLVRLMNGDTLWLSRWQGRAKYSPFVAAAFSDPETLGRTWRPVQDSLLRFGESLGDDRLAESVSYLTHSGRTVSRPLWQILLQGVERATARRALLIAAIRAGGERAVHVDLSHFLDRRDPTRSR